MQFLVAPVILGKALQRRGTLVRDVAEHRAEMTPDPTIGSGRCSPERGCHEVTGVEKSEIPFDRMAALVPTKKAQL